MNAFGCIMAVETISNVQVDNYVLIGGFPWADWERSEANNLNSTHSRFLLQIGTYGMAWNIITMHCSLCVHDYGMETLDQSLGIRNPREVSDTHFERGNRHMANVCVELLLCSLLVVTFPWSLINAILRKKYDIKEDNGNALSSFTRSRWGTVLMPCAHTAWLSLGSSRTSVVPIAFRANSTTDLIAQGARFLKERPCTRLCRWMVYSRVTTSLRAERVLPPVWEGGKIVGPRIILHILSEDF